MLSAFLALHEGALYPVETKAHLSSGTRAYGAVRHFPAGVFGLPAPWEFYHQQSQEVLPPLSGLWRSKGDQRNQHEGKF